MLEGKTEQGWGWRGELQFKGAGRGRVQEEGGISAEA